MHPAPSSVKVVLLSSIQTYLARIPSRDLLIQFLFQLRTGGIIFINAIIHIEVVPFMKQLHFT